MDMKTTTQTKAACGCKIDVEHETTYDLDCARKRKCPACRAAVRAEYDAKARDEKVAEYRAQGHDTTRAVHLAGEWIQAQRSLRGA